MTKKTRLMTITQIARMYPVFSELAWRQRFRRKKYGIAKCIIYIDGKRGHVLIDADRLEKWIDSKRWRKGSDGRNFIDEKKLKGVKK